MFPITLMPGKVYVLAEVLSTATNAEEDAGVNDIDVPDILSKISYQGMTTIRYFVLLSLP